MASIEASELLRPGLLQGVSMLIAGSAASVEEHRAPAARDGSAEVGVDGQARPQSPPRSLGASVHRACAGLGARVRVVTPPADSSPGEQDEAIADLVKAAASELGGVAVLVVDAADLFAVHLGGGTVAGGDGEQARGEGEQDRGRAAMRGCLQETWSVTRAAANVALLAGGQGGRIVYLAPRPLSGRHAGAACAGLENLARTLSIEWSRHTITTVAIAPGDATSDEDVAALTAYLASAAGGYFSGCLLDLRGPAGDPR
jgi:NAD(P)-dependent dehydrogenase (short-subunit alcohol dehydrogenase family)